MGLILHFPKWCRAGTRDRLKKPGMTAEILIFTGVRYERLPDETKPTRKRRANTVKRKKRVRQA
jgi:hypothetical protein